MTARVAAGVVKLAWEGVAREYAIPCAELLRAAQLQEQDLSDAGALLPASTLDELLRFALERSGDPGLGVRLAQALDLRLQGFGGYALLSSLTLRERIQIQLRYQRLRSPSQLSLHLAEDRAILEIAQHCSAPDLLPVMLDWTVTSVLLQHAQRPQASLPEMEIWLSYRERPHHRALRALVSGPFVFDAPCNRLQFPARDLDQKLDGDPHLAALATAELDKQLARLTAGAPYDMLSDVRERLEARLARDASLEGIARELRISARTLRRRLDERGASFHQLLQEVRHARAVAYLADTDQSVERVAAQLGYGDPSNFRRAFRRWTGLAPSDFRAGRGCKNPHDYG